MLTDYIFIIFLFISRFIMALLFQMVTYFSFISFIILLPLVVLFFAVLILVGSVELLVEWMLKNLCENCHSSVKNDLLDLFDIFKCFSKFLFF